MAGVLLRGGLPENKVFHLPNFLDPSGVMVGTTPGEGWLYAGRLAPEKGVDTLIEAAARLPQATLTVCGSGPLEPRLRAAAEALPQTRLLGQLPRALLAHLIAEARVVAVPSRWPENYPYAVLEAQAAGRAVVASEIGGIPEQIRSGKDGILVPAGDAPALADAVGGLLADPGAASALGAAARKRVLDRSSPAAHLDQLLHFYAAAIAQKNQSSTLKNPGLNMFRSPRAPTRTE